MFRHIYLHLPYCVVKCPYCDFFSVADDHRINDFIPALEREMDIAIEEYGPLDSVETVYIGGGTPTHMSSSDIERIGDMLKRRVKLRESYEWTVEANPESASQEKLELYHAMGANRVSLGVQSFDTGELQFLGRAHSADQVEVAVDSIHGAGFTNWSLDLMFGLAKQTLGTLDRTIDRSISFEPSHISAYSLMIEPGSEYARDVSPARFQSDDDFAAEAFDRVIERLDSAGYEHYEVSNYAQPGFYSHHNEAYWLRRSYLGLGPSAHSFNRDGTGGERRWWNVRSIDGYLDRLADGSSPIAGGEDLDQWEALEERVMLGLRRSDGLVWASFDAVLCESIRHKMAPMADRGLVVMDYDGIRIQRDGWPLNDAIIRSVVDAVAEGVFILRQRH
jgi:putative oxygen-independent coproporphyrinogen III oxidase